MTTPNPTLPVIVPVGNTPGAISPRVDRGQVMIQNNDTTANVFVGYGAGITESNTIPLAPGASALIPTFQQVYAFTDSGNPPVNVLVSPATQLNLGPGQISAIVDLAGLASAVALAIAQSGVPLLSNPVPLYTITAQAPSGGRTGKFGLTAEVNLVPQSANDQQTAGWASAVGVPVQTRKLFRGAGNFTTAIGTDVQVCIDLGMSAYVAFQPAFNPPTTADQTSMLNALAAYHAAGLTIEGVIMHNEPENTTSGISGPQYVAMYAFYYAALHAAGYRVISCHFGSDLTNFPAYTPAAANVDGFLVDFYGQAYVNGKRVDPVFTQAAAYGMPAGIGEFDTANAAMTLNQSQGTAYLNYIIGLAQGALNGGNQIESFMWDWNNTKAPDGNITSSTDYRIPLLRTLQGIVTSSPTSGPPSLAAGASVTLPPLNPLPAGPTFAPATTISYDALFMFKAAAASTNPFVRIAVNWSNQDTLVNQTVARQQWIMPMGGSASAFGSTIRGTGPQHGQAMQITLQNLDTQPMTYQVVVNATSRTVRKHDWRWASQGTIGVPTFTRANDSDDNVLYEAVAGKTVNAGTSSSWLFSVFAGQAFLNLKVNGAAGTNTVHFTFGPVPSSEFSTAEEFSAYLPSAAGVTGNEAFFTIALPRGPSLLTVVNSDANNVTITAILVPIENP